MFFKNITGDKELTKYHVYIWRCVAFDSGLQIRRLPIPGETTPAFLEDIPDTSSKEVQRRATLLNWPSMPNGPRIPCRPTFERALLIAQKAALTWDEGDSHIALCEGWDIEELPDDTLDLNDAENFLGATITFIKGEEGTLKDDASALQHCQTKARLGSELHIKAIRYQEAFEVIRETIFAQRSHLK